MDRSSWFNLRQRTASLFVSATGVLILTTVGTLLVRMISSVTLTRLLTPETFGLVGIISSIFFAIALLTDLGFQAHVLRHSRGDETHFQDVIWTIHCLRGLTLTALGIACAPAVAWALDKPEIAWPLAIASFTFAIDGAASLALMTILRTNQSRTLSLLDFGVTAFQTAISITLAMAIRNVWAIVFAMIVSSAFKAVISYRIAGKGHRLSWDGDIRREFWGFSRLIMASGFVTLLISQADKFVLARFLTLAEFGFYTTASTLATAPQAIANAYMLRILYPLYAQTFRDQPDQLSNTFYSAGRNMKRLYWLGGGALVGGGPLIVRILYDPRYLSAGPFLSILAVSTLLTLSNKATSGVLMVQGNTRFTLTSNMVRLAWLFATIPLGYYYFGTIGIITACGCTEIPIYIYSSSVLARYNIYRFRGEVPNFLYAAVGGLLSILASNLIRDIAAI